MQTQTEEIEQIEQELAECVARIVDVARRARALEGAAREVLIRRLRAGDVYAQRVADEFAKIDEPSLPLGLVGLGRGVCREPPPIPPSRSRK